MTFSTDDGSIYLLYALVALPLLIIFPLIIRTLSRIRLSRLYHSRTILAEYEPPAGLTPAELGYMYDAKIKSNEFIATAFDLEYKNIIIIDVAGGLSLPVDASTKQPLKPHEEFIVAIIGRGEYTSLFQDVSLLNTHTFKQAVSQSLVAQGLIRPHLYQRLLIGILKMTRLVFFFYSALIVLFFAIFKFAPSTSIGVILFVSAMMFVGFTALFAPLYVFLGAVLTYIYVKLDGMCWIGTKLLKQTWPDIEGYRMYIKQAQLNRLNFASEELREKALEKDFSYAVALRMKIDWKSRFKVS